MIYVKETESIFLVKQYNFYFIKTLFIVPIIVYSFILDSEYRHTVFYKNC